MKKCLLLLLISLFMFSVNSCKKNEDTPPVTEPIPTPVINGLIKTEVISTSLPTPFFATLEYDSLRRLLSIKGGAQLSHFESYIYSADTAFKIDLNYDTISYLLNSHGYIIFDSAYNNALTYDTDWHIISRSLPNYLYEAYTYYDGNKISSISYNSDGSIDSQEAYTYLTDRLDYRDMGSNWRFGIGSKNLVNTIIKTFIANSNTDTTKFSYVFDSKGRVSKETINHSYSSGTPGPPRVTEYTYFD